MARESSAQEIGRRMAARRRDAGYSQRTVARRVGLDPSYLSRIETGKVQPTLGTVMRIAAALRLSLDGLVGPSPPERLGQHCPVSARGTCLLDRIDTSGHPGGPVDFTVTTPQQLRLLRQATRMVHLSPPHVLKALEILFNEMLEPGAERPRAQ